MSKDFNHSMKIIGLAIITLVLAGLIILFAPRASLAPISEHPYDVPTPENPQPVSPVTLDTLASGDTVHADQTITGKAPGGWFFEASFPVSLKKSDGTVFAKVPAQTTADWMVTTAVGFSVKLPAILPYTGPGTIMFQIDNPSGNPFTEDATNTFSIPVVFQ